MFYSQLFVLIPLICLFSLLVCNMQASHPVMIELCI